MNQVTHILCAVDESSGAEQLLPLVYDELRKLAAQKLAQETPGHTLQPTGKLRRELTGHVHPDVYSVYTRAFSPDGKFLATGDREGRSGCGRQLPASSSERCRRREAGSFK